MGAQYKSSPTGLFKISSVNWDSRLTTSQLCKKHWKHCHFKARSRCYSLLLILCCSLQKIAHKLRGIPLSIMEQYVFSTAPISLKTIDFAAKVGEISFHKDELDCCTGKLAFERFGAWMSLRQLFVLTAARSFQFSCWLLWKVPSVICLREKHAGF